MTRSGCPRHRRAASGSERRPVRQSCRFGERGVVGGGEALAFGVLILLAGSLAFLNVWSIIDTRVALDAAGREYLRTYTEQGSSGPARILAEEKLREALRRRGSDPADLRIEVIEPNGFGPCSVVTVRIAATVRWFKVPFLGASANTRVSIQNRELIDANSEVKPDDNYDATVTACYED